MTKCAVFTQAPQACLLRCLFGDAQRQALALASHASRTPPGSFLRPSCDAGSTLALGMLPGAIWNLKKCNSQNAFTSLFDSVPFSDAQLSAIAIQDLPTRLLEAGGPPLGISRPCLLASSLAWRGVIALGGWSDFPGHQMAGCGGRYGLSRWNLQPNRLPTVVVPN